MWLCQERLDIGVMTNRLAGQVQATRQIDFRNARKLLRYLSVTRDWKAKLVPEGVPVRREGADRNLVRVDGFSDSDWAGCADTRASRSGWCVYVCGALITGGTRRQRTVSLSSCEAEFYAATVCTQEVLNVCELVGEITGTTPRGLVYLDSNSARALATKVGVARTKHLETRSLWLQQQVQDRRVMVVRVGTLDNVSDLLTKVPNPGVQRRLLPQLGFSG